MLITLLLELKENSALKMLILMYLKVTKLVKKIYTFCRGGEGRGPLVQQHTRHSS